ncbi:MAG: J domain-containing protein, partial [Synergistaceae bacterium]|nr:J domain-containing protein [Synergistaceae bacterium]
DGINDGPSGDLYLMIDVEKHPDFERDGPDLHTNLILTYPQAVLGTTAKINTLDGSVTEINIPAGTYQGQVFKVKGKGMPKINSLNAKGDLYAHVYIEIPKQLTEKQRELIKALADEMKTPVNGEQGFFDKVKNLFS